MAAVNKPHEYEYNLSIFSYRNWVFRQNIYAIVPEIVFAFVLLFHHFLLPFFL